MKKSVMGKAGIAAFAAVLGLAVLAPATADARVFVGVGFGGYGGYYGGYGGYYAPAYYPYYAPYYYPPPAQVDYEQPATTYVAPPAPAPVATSAASGGTYTDNFGRTCRHFQHSSGSLGTSCLQTDGTWKTVS